MNYSFKYPDRNLLQGSLQSMEHWVWLCLQIIITRSSQDFTSLLSSKHLTDITIKCEEKLFDCHQIILASRSQVFKTMFESNMKEKLTGSVFLGLLNAASSCPIIFCLHVRANCRSRTDHHVHDDFQKDQKQNLKTNQFKR